MDYLRWIRNNFTKIELIDDQILHEVITAAKADSATLNELFKVLGVLFIVVPFNVYLAVSGLLSYDNLSFWLVMLITAMIGVGVSLYIEQEIIKRKIAQSISKLKLAGD
ncbi:hypothetical protein [Pseudoalteromonas sp. HM-SA03]|uniref:hypothetical protein n=1 Tax=Pseudoalteromonas sp. HM-SA03 TaxID=2029678 RepID=UPI001140E7CE|nr:hypothetical protein [Pseudoalteromonas sp. HM-SA03]